MPDTKIHKLSTGGWIDVDVPTVTHPVRRLARLARRSNLGLFPRNQFAPVGGPVFTSLQQRLYDRLTQRQGVLSTDAEMVILNNGYNKAASYGHMREAGANHNEALFVISLGEAGVSLEYGQLRAQGQSHASAFATAFLSCTSV